MQKLEILQGRQASFDKADNQNRAYQEQIDLLNREIEALNVQLNENDFNIRVYKKENEQLKEDILNVDQGYFKAKEEQRKLMDKNNELEGLVMSYKARFQEDGQKMVNT